MDTLSEVAVADADVATAAIYRSIMQHSGTGTPALIFRHFAVFPGFLDWTWRAVGEELESGQVILQALDAVARTRRVALPAIGARDLAAAGVDGAARPLLAGILASYNRMNPMNYSLIAAIRELIARPEARADDAAPLPPATARPLAPCPTLPPPVNVADMAEDLQQTMIALGKAIPSPGAQLVPTLYRHLAIWPELMRLLAPGLLAAIDSGVVAARMTELKAGMAPLVTSVTARARRKGLPPVPLDEPQAMLRTLDSFLVAIPQMTVIGAAIEAAMPPPVAR